MVVTVVVRETEVVARTPHAERLRCAIPVPVPVPEQDLGDVVVQDPVAVLIDSIADLGRTGIDIWKRVSAVKGLFRWEVPLRRSTSEPLQTWVWARVAISVGIRPKRLGDHTLIGRSVTVVVDLVTDLRRVGVDVELVVVAVAVVLDVAIFISYIYIL